MGNIILLDLITLNYINFPFFFFQGYPYYINNFIVFPHNFSTLIDCQSYYNFFFLDLLIPDHFEYFTLCKFYLYFNQLVIPLGFLFIYLIILTISIFTKIRLYLEFKHLVKKFIFYLRVLNFKNLFIFYPYFY